MILILAIATRIKDLIQARRWTSYRLSDASGVPKSTISNLIRGVCNSCNLFTIINICRGLGIELVEFFNAPYFSLAILEDK